MKINFALSVLLCLAAAAIGCWVDRPDGCSNLYIGRWENTFTSSCNKHDMCYICGGGRHHNWSRKFCDDAFKHDMRKACSKVRKGNWWSNPRRDCYDWSNIYYRAVRVGGHLSYNKNYCSESCIKSQGDPGRRITL